MPIFDVFEGIAFEVRIREQNHPVPHVHAHYGGEDVSISLIDGSVLAGGFFRSRKKQRIAQAYTVEHRTALLEKWREYHV